MGTTVNLGVETLLRPGWNFEADYDGYSGDVPILFTWPGGPRPALGLPDYSVLDEDARKSPPRPGISPMLAKFVQTPPGSSMLFLFPVVTRMVGLGIRPWVYVWRIVWRWRSAGDYVKTDKRRPYIIGKTSFGAPDSRTTLVPGRDIPVAGNRYVVPGVMESVIYGKQEPDTYQSIGVPYYGDILHDAVAIPTEFKSVTKSPIYPGQRLSPAPIPPPDTYSRTLQYQQGIFDPSFPGVSNPEDPSAAFNPLSATHVAKWIKSLGNEYAVECYKFELPIREGPLAEPERFTPRNWSFDIQPDGSVGPAAEDLPFSAMFGIGAESLGKTIPESTGVRVTVGTAPA